MTDSEFGTFSTYITSLWPKLTLNQDQCQVWFARLRNATLFDARNAAARHYESSKFAPTLADIAAELKKTRNEHREQQALIPNEQVEAIMFEENEEAEILADWTDDDRESGRKQIIEHEHGMEMLIGRCGLRHPMLTHFLVERFVNNRATVFPKSGVPIQISRDEYWGAK